MIHHAIHDEPVSVSQKARKAAERVSVERIIGDVLQGLEHVSGATDRILAIRSEYATAERVEVERLREQVRDEVINTPETADFMAAVPLEAAHQRDRWRSSHDAGKNPFDWFWLVGYLCQKAAEAQLRGDTEKALHHTISTAAALANWHATIAGRERLMRPGIGPENGGERPGSAFSLAAALHPSTDDGAAA